MAFFRLAMRASVGVNVVAALVLTYAAGAGPSVEPGMAAGVTLVLLAIGVSHYFTLRFVVLPGMLRQAGTPADGLRIIADSFSAAPGVYGLVASIATGQGLIVLPFAAVSAALFYVLGSHLDEEIARRAKT